MIKTDFIYLHPTSPRKKKRKFNVSVTRAMSLCIVVGEPYTLYADTYWSQYIEACDAKGGYMGDDCLLRKRYQATRDLQDADEVIVFKIV